MLLVVSHGGGVVARAMFDALGTLPGGKRLVTLGSEPCAIPGFECMTLGACADATRRALLAGVVDLVLLPTLDLAETEGQLALLAIAADSGVRRVHHVSRVGADRPLPVSLVRWSGRVESAIRETGLPHNVLRCAPFMQNIGFFVDGPPGRRRLVGPFRDATFPWLDARDVGEIIAGAIATGGAESTVCQLAGDEDVGLETIACWLGEALGREVPFEDVSGPEMAGYMAARGIPVTRIRIIGEYWDYLVSGVVSSRPCPTAAERLGHPPRRLRAYIAELAHELAGASVNVA